ncbi:hypothetical protein PIB30_094042 [Stylosanthes scabra]|uniref:Uncharacterized protein n=1 Tax=Stylosanthes scabra TaxID=79078 RepID=A0ABU6XVK5_9FABA|nr:hypothetical protein [Stylosanthes scabra]
MQGGYVEMKESEGKEESEPEENPEEDPEEEVEKSKEVSDAQPMGASTELDFLRFLTSGQQPMCSSSGSCPSINSQNPSQSSGLSSSTRSFHISDLSGVWPSSSAPTAVFSLDPASPFIATRSCLLSMQRGLGTAVQSLVRAQFINGRRFPEKGDKKINNAKPRTSLRIHSRDYDSIIDDPEDPFNSEKILFPFAIEEKLSCFVSPLLSKEEAEKAKSVFPLSINMNC